LDWKNKTEKTQNLMMSIKMASKVISITGCHDQVEETRDVVMITDRRSRIGNDGISKIRFDACHIKEATAAFKSRRQYAERDTRGSVPSST